jgi:hypothetical protein
MAHAWADSCHGNTLNAGQGVLARNLRSGQQQELHRKAVLKMNLQFFVQKPEIECMSCMQASVIGIEGAAQTRLSRAGVELLYPRPLKT